MWQTSRILLRRFSRTSFLMVYDQSMCAISSVCELILLNVEFTVIL